MIRMPLDNHGPIGQRLDIEVDTTDDGAAVDLILIAEPMETIEDRDILRVLQPHEARALAAVLVHFAAEAERR